MGGQSSQVKNSDKAFSDNTGEKCRIPLPFLRQENSRKTPFSWTSGIVSSVVVLGLVASGPAWGAKAIVTKNLLSSSLSSSPYLTSVLPPLTPPEIWDTVLDKASPIHREILFVDLGVENYQDLLGSLSREVDIVYLPPDEDGVAAIAAYLDGRRDLQGIHIISHGGPGRLYLGNTTLTVEDLTDRRHDLARWAKALGPEGDVLLYGCEVASGLEGIRFVNRLAHTLTAGVSASDDPTGSPVLGGDWTLEYRDNVATKPIFTASVADDFYALLADGQVIAGDGSGGGGGGGGTGGKYYSGGNGGPGGSGGGDADTINGTVDNDLIFGDGSGGGGGGRGDNGKYYGIYGDVGPGGIGGSGNDILNGGDGDDIIFGDGFDGFAGDDSGYSGGYGGFGNLNSGSGGDAMQGGQAGFGGALGGSAGEYIGKYYSGSDGQPGDNGSTTTVTLTDTGGTIHSDTTIKIANGYFASITGGDGDDTLDGGPGSDALFGMGGTNIFVFESSDAFTGSDVDTIHDWNNGTDNKIALKTWGENLTKNQVRFILSGQVTSGDDRIIVHAKGANQVTIEVKGIGRDLVLEDFIVGQFPWTMFLPSIVAPKEE